MKNTIQLVSIVVALGGLSLGFFSDPFGKKEAASDPVEVERSYLKAKIYLDNGNFEGSLAVAKKLPKKLPPRYSDIREIEKQAELALHKYKQKIKEGVVTPSRVDRLPAALRDSYYDATIEAQRGHCRAAYEAMVPVSKYLKNREDLEIFRKCRLTGNKSK